MLESALRIVHLIQTCVQIAILNRVLFIAAVCDFATKSRISRFPVLDPRAGFEQELKIGHFERYEWRNHRIDANPHAQIARDHKLFPNNEFESDAREKRAQRNSACPAEEVAVLVSRVEFAQRLAEAERRHVLQRRLANLELLFLERAQWLAARC